MTSLSALCLTLVCVAVGKPISSNPKPFTLFIYDSEAVFVYVYNNALGELISCFYSNEFEYLLT